MKTLEQLHASRKRWMTRLVRATHEVAKLDKQIHRMNGKLKATTIGHADGRIEQRALPVAAEPIAKTDDLRIPEVLDRAIGNEIAAANERINEPQLVDKLKAKRPPVDKTKMPLSGRKAEAFLKDVKAQSEAVTARRKKRKLA